MKTILWTMTVSKSKKYIYLYLDILKDFDVMANLGLRTANLAKNKNCRINLTGSGSDELYSDYGFNGVKFYGHRSMFGGLFPQQLETIFPWYTNKRYPIHVDLRTIEYANGLYGIDSRHPFLDKRLFQTWLNSKNNIKNDNYKNWIEQYMIDCNYPYAQQKIGLGNYTINII